LFIAVLVKHSLSVFDSIALILMYVIYLWFLKKTPPAKEESAEEMEFVPKNISKIKSRFFRWICITSLFVAGGVIFYTMVHPFVETCEKIAIKMGLTTFVFIQWVAPFLTEFPEKLTVFYWAKNEKKAPIGLLNLLNANISQWTLLPAIIPIFYFFASGKYSIEWDFLHRKEIALTMSQTVFLVTLLLDRNLSFWDSILIFLLWLIQFLNPTLREELIYLYLGLSILKIITCVIKKHRTKIYLDFLLLLKRTTKVTATPK
jgi:cation:H+ antiporter